MPEINNSGLNPAMGPPLSSITNTDSAKTDTPTNEIKQSSEHLANSRQDPTATRVARAGISIAELFAASPLIFSSLINQAETIAQEKDNVQESFFMSFLTGAISTLSAPFRAAYKLFIESPYDSPIDSMKHAVKDTFNKLSRGEKIDSNIILDTKNQQDVTINDRPFLFENFAKRILNRNVAKELASLIFVLRRSLFNFWPSAFTVPSEEHDPNNPKGRQAGALSTRGFGMLSKLYAPLRFTSSAITTAFAVPSHLLGVIYAYLGNQKAFDFTKYMSSIWESILPVTANISSLFRVSKACLDSFLSPEKTSKAVSFGKFNVGFSHIIQATFGSILSVPYFFGALNKMRELISERDLEAEKEEKLSPNMKSYVLANKSRDFAREIINHLKNFNLLQEGTSTKIQTTVYSVVNKLIQDLNDHTENFLNNLMNSNEITRNIFSKIRPADINGNLIATQTDKAIESSNTNDNYIKGPIKLKKSNLLGEIYELLHPIQSLLMLLPNAFVALSDPYIQDNGTRLFRGFDKLVGINSFALSLPTYYIYACKHRIPQIIIKWHEIKQRQQEAIDPSYDAYNDFNARINQLKYSNLPGTGYIRKALENLDIQPGDFKDRELIKRKFTEIEKEAREQEHSVKASELVQASRIGLRHVMGQRWSFIFAPRDADGLTAEEQGKRKVYDAMGNFSAQIKGIPVVGWVAGPIIELFRSFYKINPREIKRLPGWDKNKAANPMAEMLEKISKAPGVKATQQAA